MKKKSKSAKRTFVTLRQFVLYNAILIPVLLGGFYALFVYAEYRTPKWQSPHEFALLITDAAGSLTTETSLVPQNTTQYMPEMNLQFPLRKNTRLAYGYSEAFEGSSEYATVTSQRIKDFSARDIMTQQTHDGVFERVQAYQNCQRIFILMREDQEPERYDAYTKVATVSLSDGQLYVWKTDETLCRASLENAEDSAISTILETLTSAQSLTRRVVGE